MPQVFLATFALMPDGEGGPRLVDALARHGVRAAWAVWDDPDVDWGAAELVVARSVWDYHRRLPEFLAWARSVESTTRLLNGAEVFARNADKRYLLDLEGPTVPSALLTDRDLVPGLRSALARWGSVVVKPCVGASGLGVVVADSLDDPRLFGLSPGPWLVQPLVESVRTDGETSIWVFAGRAVAQADKRPAGGEIRVHEEYGGQTVQAPLDPARAAIAERAVAAAGAPAYARVDLMRWEGRWSVSELELVEPGLYLDLVPENAEHFARLVAGRL